MLQVVMQFQSGNSGWSETHFYNSDQTTDLILPFGSAAQPLADLMRYRLGLMPYNPVLPAGGILDQLSNPRLLRVRVSNINPGEFRVVRVFEPPLSFSFGTYSQTAPGEVKNAVEAWTRLLCYAQLVDNQNQSREGRLFLGGAPESQLQPTQAFAPTGPFETALFNYFFVLTGGPTTVSLWRTRLRNQALTAPAAVAISGLVPSADGKSAVVTCNPGGGFNTVGQVGQVTIRGRHPSEWNGVHRFVITAAAPVVTLTVGPAREQLGDWVTSPGVSPMSGTAQVYNPGFASYQFLAPVNFIHRDNGVPFGQPRGRRKRAR